MAYNISSTLYRRKYPQTKERDIHINIRAYRTPNMHAQKTKSPQNTKDKIRTKQSKDSALKASRKRQKPTSYIKENPSEKQLIFPSKL